MPGYRRDTDAIRAAALRHREEERLRRETRANLLAQRDRIVAKIKASQMYRDGDPTMLRAVREFERDTGWIGPRSETERQLLEALDPADPGPIRLEEKPRRQNRLVALYTRLFGGRKAGQDGLHGEDGDGLLPEGGSAVSGVSADGSPPGGEPDADPGRLSGGGRSGGHRRRQREEGKE